MCVCVIEKGKRIEYPNNFRLPLGFCYNMVRIWFFGPYNRTKQGVLTDNAGILSTLTFVEYYNQNIFLSIFSQQILFSIYTLWFWICNDKMSI